MEDGDRGAMLELHLRCQPEERPLGHGEVGLVLEPHHGAPARLASHVTLEGHDRAAAGVAY